MNRNDQHSVPFDLIAKYLADEVTDGERQQVMDWMLENEDEFERIVQSWEKTETAIKQPTFDVDLAWGKVQNQISAQEAPAKIRRLEIWMQPMRIAAAVVALFALGWLIINILGPNVFSSTQTEVTFAEKKEVELMDGSAIALNRDTKLVYPKEFKGDTREVTLSGEAFFDIAEDKEKPFIVSTEDLRVRVLGTSFNIDARKQSDSITVTVKSGVVEVAVMRNGVQVQIDTLRANTQIKYIKSSQSLLEKEPPKPDYSTWNTGELQYHIIKVQEIAEVLSRIYEIDIQVDPIIKDCELRAAVFSPENESIIEALEVLSGGNIFFTFEEMNEGKTLIFRPASSSCDKNP